MPIALLAVFVGCSSSSPTGSAAAATDDPADAQFVTSGISNFWSAYDAGGKTGSAMAFQAGYLNPASAGLQDFIGKRALTATSLAQMVVAYPRYFASIRSNTLTLAQNGTVLARIRSANGMLIGTEFYGVDAGTPHDELGSFQRDNARSIDSLPYIVAHEHVHILQSRAGGIFGRSTLLEQALMEGSADFT